MERNFAVIIQASAPGLLVGAIEVVIFYCPVAKYLSVAARTTSAVDGFKSSNSVIKTPKKAPDEVESVNQRGGGKGSRGFDGRHSGLTRSHAGSSVRTPICG